MSINCPFCKNTIALKEEVGIAIGYLLSLLLVFLMALVLFLNSVIYIFVTALFAIILFLLLSFFIPFISVKMNCYSEKELSLSENNKKSLVSLLFIMLFFYAGIGYLFFTLSSHKNPISTDKTNTIIMEKKK